VSHVARAASVLLARADGSCEIFVVRRAEKLRFFGGFVAFPGGKVAPEDRESKLISPDARGCVDNSEADRCVTAARELFEETGVLLARHQDGAFPSSGSILQYLRRKLIAGDLSFGQVLGRLKLAIRADDFTYLGRVVTPSFIPTRFDTAFFHAQLPPNQDAEVWTGELAEGRWATAAAVLDSWSRGQRLVAPPTVMILGSIRDQPGGEIATRVAALLASQREGMIHPIFFAPRVQMIPLFTQALPPSTHTNAYLVGNGPVYLLDPGPTDPTEQNRLFELLDGRQAEGCGVTAIVLTHHHPDHVGAATVCAERYRIPIYAHPWTAQKLKARITVNREIQPGDRLELGITPDGERAWYLETIHTPGHAPGHLAFYDPYYKLLFAGDMVSTLSSVVIAPPEGDLGAYLESLKCLKAYDCRLLLPAHGSASAQPQRTIDECIAHRKKREQQLMAALRSRPRKVPELAEQLYKGLPPKMMRLAVLQVKAGLSKLQREGRVTRTEDDEVWCTTTAGQLRPSLRRSNRL
jgi:glyoxylase-like metal-dependent hydrolase (beta-lactamase superfamily II)/8-oxo-dGTP pyrophosphatase MutT (NUDIX family)